MACTCLLLSIPVGAVAFLIAFAEVPWGDVVGYCTGEFAYQGDISFLPFLVPIGLGIQWFFLIPCGITCCLVGFRASRWQVRRWLVMALLTSGLAPCAMTIASVGAMIVRYWSLTHGK